ncbi:fungal-specific transcription factor domain-containing protein [Tricladium varicosporioides]|nr:fungal-specific transcription factor domain-containing protein [Hymenoscyphus varicosporioides]
MALSASHSRRRDKPILSCNFCRGHKLRCDRQSPCSSCVRRGKHAECTYSTSEQERKDAIDYRPYARNQQARQRVARLENLVTEMREMEHRSRQPSDDRSLSSELLNNPVPPLAPLDDNTIGSMGNLSLTDNHEVYVGSSHWVTILEDIRLLKDELSDEYSDGTTSQESASLSAGLMGRPPPTRVSLLTSITCLPKEQILAMIPPRKVTDRHVSHFFNTFDLAPIILHRRKFLAEYATFWVNPSAAPIMWVGLLFSVLSMSVFLQQQDVGALGFSAVESQDMLETYRNLTIHCLVAGDYLQPNRYTIETLTLHFAVDQNVNHDTYIGNWVLIGVVIRIALRMGLHRDPSHWPNIRPLQAELRRRIWISLYQMDFFTSTQIGLPRIIKDSQCDTRPPAHLFDDDIGFEHDEIPPQRPFTDPSTLLYIIQRNTIIKVAAEIYDATEATLPSSATIVALGNKLEMAVDALPTWLKYTSLETSIADSPVTIAHQMTLDVLIHKAFYLLYRRSFVKGSVGGESTKANELCIRAALAILEHQRRMSEETQPGGLLFGIRWKVVSSLNHEFLQATMMLCFALNRFKEGRVSATNSCNLYRHDDILKALNTAKSLWEKISNQSVEARRAAKAITTVLKQDLDKSSAPNLSATDTREFASVLDQPIGIDPSVGFFDQMPGIAAQSYPDSFDYGQHMAMDPSFFAINYDVAAFGGSLDDFNFLTEHAEENRAGCSEAVLAASDSLYPDTTT